MRMAAQLQIDDRVRFVGWLPREAALEALAHADIMLHPSFREGWTAALLEGMAARLAVICLDWGEPGFMVDHESGIKVPVTASRDRIVGELATAVERFTDPAVRLRAGEAARQRVEVHFSLKALDGLVETLYGSASRWQD
jgi:glycosyltransferase involved in cell wall biosynthesis